MPRESTGKRVRFEVFKRDYFTCQYCGAQPPAVVLVVDHILAVAAGGKSTIDNLTTACEPCNQGKSDKPLGAVTTRSDADLLYLQAQQEIAEMRRYQEALHEREMAMLELIDTLQDHWTRVSGLDWVPQDRVVRSLLNRYSPAVAGEALEEVALKVAGGYLKTNNGRWVAYLYTVAKNMAVERGDIEEDDSRG